ncbi:hypothetical protein CMV30_18395 [Nibricoccus aquaticus]|uniref:Uncharacterized protein n=1 Tax=Nibricoccus aquaticus TaxID=2576891 RepID=A0A290QEU7_9BACT|nr:hypothetical protein [Nibricoccus aquaticus]ATC65760.1 hypothetical protein CMV30_18395 [Nibricoccus aquaticus]
MPEETEYPPQFASSDLSALLGQINDFAGVPPPPPPPPPPPGGMELKSAKAASKSAAPAAAASDLGRQIASGEFVLPVSIVGSQSQRGPYLPGLRDQLIGVAILRLAEQIVDTNQKSSAKKVAQELIATGTKSLADHIAKERKKTK